MIIESPVYKRGVNRNRTIKRQNAKLDAERAAARLEWDTTPEPMLVRFHQDTAPCFPAGVNLLLDRDLAAYFFIQRRACMPVLRGSIDAVIEGTLEDILTPEELREEEAA
jgi:hypothetical protein